MSSIDHKTADGSSLSAAAGRLRVSPEHHRDRWAGVLEDYMLRVFVRSLEIAAKRGEGIEVADLDGLGVCSALGHAIDSADLAQEIGASPDERRANVTVYRSTFPSAPKLVNAKVTVDDHGAPAVRGGATIVLGAKVLATRARGLAGIEDLNDLDDLDRAHVARVIASLLATTSLTGAGALIARRRRFDQALDLAESSICAFQDGTSTATLPAGVRRWVGRIGKRDALRRNLQAARGIVEDEVNDRVRSHRRRASPEHHRFVSSWGKLAYYLGVCLALEAPTPLAPELGRIKRAVDPSRARARVAAEREKRNQRQRMHVQDRRFEDVERCARALAKNPSQIRGNEVDWPGDLTSEQLTFGLEHLLTWLSTRQSAPLPVTAGTPRAANELKTGFRRVGERIIECAARHLSAEPASTAEDRIYFNDVADDFAPSAALDESRTP